MTPIKYVILVRNPGNGAVFLVRDGDGDNAALFATPELAEEGALETTVCKAWPYSIVEAP